MKTIMKTLFVVLTSFALLTSANAGELSVTGSAKASWSNVSETQSGKQISIANELLFSASGEMDNGYTWTYTVALDPTTAGTADSTTTPPAGSAINDDQTLNIGIPGIGTVGIGMSAGGFNAKYGWSSDAYYVKSDTGKNEGITYPDDLGSYSNLTYTSEAGLLPLGTVFQAGYGYAKSDGQSLNAAGIAGADTGHAFGLTMKPVDGLTVGATYNSISAYGNGDANRHSQDEQGGAAYAKYAMGPITVGYGKSWKAPTLAVATSAGATTVEYYENRGYSIGYALNDAVRVSYTNEKSQAHYKTSSTTAYDVGVASYQIAYNIGGATIALARSDVENAGYVNNIDWTETVLAIAMAF